MRQDQYEQSLTNHRANTVTEQSLNAASPRAGVVYQPSKQLSLYATAAKSFRPNSGVSRDFTSFPPEKGRSYEVGAKLDSADQKVTSTLALYSIAKNNVLTPDPLDPNNFSVAAGEVKSKGVEFDVSGEVYPTIRLSAAYAFTDAKVTEDNNSFLVGRQTANVPRHSGSLMVVKAPGEKMPRIQARVGQAPRRTPLAPRISLRTPPGVLASRMLPASAAIPQPIRIQLTKPRRMTTTWFA